MSTGTSDQITLKIQTLQRGGQSLAGSTPPEHVTPITQTSPKEIWTFPNHQSDFPYDIPTPTTLLMEDPPHISCLTSHPLQGDKGTREQLYGTTP